MPAEAQPISTGRESLRLGHAVRRPLSRLMSQVLQSGLIILAALVSYYVISHYFLQSVRVSGVSMQPTLRNSQHCFLNRWIFHVRSPARGDVVVIRDPQDGSLAVKRIVGVGGDTVSLGSGPVLLNGKVLNEPYLPQGTKTFPGPQFREQTLKCPPGEFIVLGDNRNNSSDSRTYGTVPRRDILGLIIE